MERLILPLIAVFGFLGSFFFDADQAGVAKVTQTQKADFQGDS